MPGYFSQLSYKRTSFLTTVHVDLLSYIGISTQKDVMVFAKMRGPGLSAEMYYMKN